MISSPPWLKAYLTSNGSPSTVISTIVGIRREIIQFDILVFVEPQEINFPGTLKVNIINTAYFYVNIFHFTKRFCPLLTL